MKKNDYYQYFNITIFSSKPEIEYKIKKKFEEINEAFNYQLNNTTNLVLETVSTLLHNQPKALINEFLKPISFNDAQKKFLINGNINKKKFDKWKNQKLSKATDWYLKELIYFKQAEKLLTTYHNNNLSKYIHSEYLPLLITDTQKQLVSLFLDIDYQYSKKIKNTDNIMRIEFDRFHDRMFNMYKNLKDFKSYQLEKINNDPLNFLIDLTFYSYSPYSQLSYEKEYTDLRNLIDEITLKLMLALIKYNASNRALIASFINEMKLEHYNQKNIKGVSYEKRKLL